MESGELKEMFDSWPGEATIRDSFEILRVHTNPEVHDLHDQIQGLSLHAISLIYQMFAEVQRLRDSL